MNLSGILVVAAPGRLAEVAGQLARLPGVQVHQHEAATGRMIVTQEAASVDDEVEGLKRIKAMPGVALAEMVYHYVAEDPSYLAAEPEDIEARSGPGPAGPT
jgi:nitrate reductase NapD